MSFMRVKSETHKFWRTLTAPWSSAGLLLRGQEGGAFSVEPSMCNRGCRWTLISELIVLCVQQGRWWSCACSGGGAKDPVEQQRSDPRIWLLATLENPTNLPSWRSSCPELLDTHLLSL